LEVGDLLIEDRALRIEETSFFELLNVPSTVQRKPTQVGADFSCTLAAYFEATICRLGRDTARSLLQVLFTKEHYTNT